MRRAWLAAGALAGLVAACGSPVHAWSASTRVRLTEDALKVMPRSLREILREHRDELLRGSLEPMTAEDEPAHRPPWDAGTLPERIAEASDAIPRAVAGQRPFAEVARRFGDLAHYVADAGFPPNAGASGDERRYRHFTDLVDDRLDRVRFVFYGHDDPDLARSDVQAFARSVLARARGQDADLARAYASAGDPPNPAAFDDRSVPFAIASLAYSQTATAIAQAWIDAWRQGGGDMTRIPYWKREPAEGLDPGAHQP